MIIHTNEWPWGQTQTIVYAEGVGIVDMSFSNKNKGVCYISGLSVLPTYQRQGIATFLMEECIDICKRSGIFRIDLNSILEPFVLDFYHKLGFVDAGEEDGFMSMYKMLR